MLRLGGECYAFFPVMDREDITAPPMPKPGIVQHEESFEVVKADGSVEFVYFDENPGRRVINGRLSKEAAFARAQELLKVVDDPHLRPSLCRSGLQLSSRQSRGLPGRLDAPERICRQFSRMLPEHIDPSTCKLRNDAEKFSW